MSSDFCETLGTSYGTVCYMYLLQMGFQKLVTKVQSAGGKLSV